MWGSKRPSKLSMAAPATSCSRAMTAILWSRWKPSSARTGGWECCVSESSFPRSFPNSPSRGCGCTTWRTTCARSMRHSPGYASSTWRVSTRRDTCERRRRQETATTSSRNSQGTSSQSAHTTGMSEARLLVVDDEPNIRELLAASLRFNGFEVETVGDGQSALRRAMEISPDLIVLDVMLPDLDGFSVTRRLREQGKHIPVLFLTARDDTADKIAGLTVGGDDYVTKPFSLDEVIARIRAVLRRVGGIEEDSTLRVADLTLNDDAHRSEERRVGKECRGQEGRTQ